MTWSHNIFSPENTMVIYHMRSVSIFVAECVTLSLMPSYQTGLFAAEDCQRSAKGQSFCLPIPALVPNHSACWTQLWVSAKVWRWLEAPETLGSYRCLRKGKRYFSHPPAGLVGIQAHPFADTRDSLWKSMSISQMSLALQYCKQLLFSWNSSFPCWCWPLLIKKK